MSNLGRFGENECLGGESLATAKGLREGLRLDIISGWNDTTSGLVAAAKGLKDGGNLCGDRDLYRRGEGVRPLLTSGDSRLDLTRPLTSFGLLLLIYLGNCFLFSNSLSSNIFLFFSLSLGSWLVESLPTIKSLKRVGVTSVFFSPAGLVSSPIFKKSQSPLQFLALAPNFSW